MGRERVTVAACACPCGLGRVRVDMTFEESDWGNRDWDWEGEIECARCAPLYAFVGAGRGVDVVRAEDKARRERLRGDAEVLERSVLESSEVGIVLDQVAAAFDALPSVAARYRLAVQLGIETATLPTFRKHV